MAVKPEANRLGQRLGESEVERLLSSGAVFIVTVRDGPHEPLFIVQDRSAGLLQRLKDTLGFGDVYCWDVPEFEARGAADCLRLVQYLGDAPPFEEELLRVYQAWMALVLYLARNPQYSLVEIQRLMAAMNPKGKRMSL